MRTEQLTAKALAAIDEDRYKLALLVAKRAEQLVNGSQPLIKADSTNLKFTDIALQEIAEGYISIGSFEEEV